jgi:hypothetical protein
MKHLPFFVLLMGLCSIAAGQNDLRIAFRDGLYGYIDRSGNWVIEPRFIEASGWEDGAAGVRLPSGDFAFIDSNGKYLMRPRRFQRLGDLREGLAVFEPEGGKYDADGFVKNVGFIDVTGHIVIAPHLFAAYDFSEGVAAASVEFGKCGYIDKQGNFVIEPKFDFPSHQNCGHFSEGLAHVMKAGKYGYIDHTGSLVIRPVYDYAFDFSEGYAVVGIGSKYAFIDKRGVVLGTFSYGYARGFSEGLAAVAPSGKWGFIDKSGTLAIPAKYEEVGDFSEGLAWVQIDGKRGYINVYGDLVVPLKYDSTSDFWNGMAEVIQYPKSEGDLEVHTIINSAGVPIPLGNR